MREDDQIVLVGIGVAVVVLATTGPKATGADLRWTWPLPRRKGLPPIITQEFRPPNHLGVDLMYPAAAAPAGWYRTPGSFLKPGLFAAPRGGAVLAALPGRIYSVGKGARGSWVMIDHGSLGVPWTTFYQHLESINVDKGQDVEAGSVIGGMGADPTDGEHIVHLHFEAAAWTRGAGRQFDPAPYLRQARYMEV